MRVLVACEFSGRVRDAFAAQGHDAWSCDLIQSETSGQHLFGNVLRYLDDGWDLLIAFPPCTHLSSSGASHWGRKRQLQLGAIDFFLALFSAPISRIAVENPVGIMSTVFCKPDQIIQPWEYGPGESKATCLWLKNLPKLRPTNVVEACVPTVMAHSPSAHRAADRSRTYPGIAAAMAQQWGKLAP
jgi:hypothetical protein